MTGDAAAIEAPVEAAREGTLRVPGGWMAAFISPSLPLGALVLPITLYLPAYYGGYVGLGLGVVGACFFAVRTLDIGLDPVVGWLLDRTRTPFGQCRPWMAAGVALTLIAVLMLFLVRPGAGPAWLIAGLLLVYGGLSMVGVAQPAWAARLAPGYDERARLYGWAQVASSGGTVILLGLPMVIAAYGRRMAGAEIRLMGVGIATLLPLTLAFALARAPEPAAPPAHRGSPSRVSFADYARLLRRGNVARLMVGDLFVSLGTATSSTLFLFFWGAARGYTGPETNLIIFAYYLCSLASTPLWVRVARMIGKRAAFIASGAGFVVIMPVMAFMPRHHLEIVVPAMCLMGLVFSATTFLIRAMAADTGDEARLDTGLDRLGQIYGLLSATTKVGSAAAVGVAFPLLERAGFHPALGAGNAPSALSALTLAYVGAPALAILLGLIAISGYRLGAREHAEVRAALAEKDAETGR